MRTMYQFINLLISSKKRAIYKQTAFKYYQI